MILLEYHINVIVVFNVHLYIIHDVPMEHALFVFAADGGDGRLSLHQFGQVVILNIPQGAVHIFNSTTAKVM